MSRAQVAPAGPPSDVQVVFDCWNETALGTPLHAARVLNAERRRAIGARLRDLGLAGVLEAIGKIGASSFCRGVNDRGWRADIGFAMRPEKCLKALEGGYDDRPGVSRSAPRPGSMADVMRSGGFRSMAPMPDDDDEHDGPTIRSTSRVMVLA